MALRRVLIAIAATLVAADPPFDVTRVTFSAAFSSSMVLQRAPAQAAVFGTAAPGATVTVQLTGPGGYSFVSPPAAVARSADASINGSWKVLLPARPAGLAYSVLASCAGCANATPAALGDVAFGDVFLCSGQSNMECPMLTTVSRNESYAQCAAGAYDHVRVFQTGWRGLGLADNPAGASSWILPRVGSGPGCGAGCEPPNSQGGYAQRTWQLPRGPGASLERFSAVCFYFGKSLSDLRSAADPAADPVPIGLISSTIGGTTIQEWLPPSATGNGTCADNNCGYVEQLNPDNPIQPSETANCKNASLASVWSCPSGLCSALWFSMIAPFVNMTLAGAIWYQGEQNVLFGRGSSTSGYQCQQAALIAAWRQAFSATPGTTAPDMPFGVVTLAGGASEGAYYYSAYQNIGEAQWLACKDSRYRTPACRDIVSDWTAGLRTAQTGGFGFAPNPALPNVFIGQNYDQGEPCLCDKTLQAPDGCWATNACFGDGPYSLNGTHCYELSSIHPRVKHIVGARLARALVGMLQGKPQPTPKLAGCRLAGQRLVLSFDAPLLGGEAVVLQAPVPGTFVPLEFQVANANVSTGTSGWVFAASLEAVNATAVAAVLPPGAGTPTAVRYAWGDYACCPGMNASTFFCPPTSCPIVTSVSQEPAVPFWASIDGGQCHCTPPWSCDA